MCAPSRRNSNIKVNVNVNANVNILHISWMESQTGLLHSPPFSITTAPSSSNNSSILSCHSSVVSATRSRPTRLYHLVSLPRYKKLLLVSPCARLSTFHAPFARTGPVLRCRGDAVSWLSACRRRHSVSSAYQAEKSRSGIGGTEWQIVLYANGLVHV